MHLKSDRWNQFYLELWYLGSFLLVVIEVPRSKKLSKPIRKQVVYLDLHIICQKTVRKKSSTRFSTTADLSRAAPPANSAQEQSVSCRKDSPRNPKFHHRISAAVGVKALRLQSDRDLTCRGGRPWKRAFNIQEEQKYFRTQRQRSGFFGVLDRRIKDRVVRPQPEKLSRR